MNGITDVDAVLAALARGAGADDDEGLDLLAHSLQCAEHLRLRAPDDTELQVAGLVHDLGTMLEPGHPESHARTGGDAVRSLLGDRVADLVAHHDVAKRYLVTTEPGYRARLTPQSITTLAAQGGLLDEPARREFEGRPNAEAYLTLRRADDDAKVPGAAVPSLEQWRAALDDCVASATRR